MSETGPSQLIVEPDNLILNTPDTSQSSRHLQSEVFNLVKV